MTSAGGRANHFSQRAQNHGRTPGNLEGKFFKRTLKSPFDRIQQAITVHRFENNVRETFFNRRFNHLFVVEGGTENEGWDRDLSMVIDTLGHLGLAKELHTVHPRHHQIGDNQIESLPGEHFQGFLCACCLVDPTFEFAETFLDQDPVKPGIVDN